MLVFRINAAVGRFLLTGKPRRVAGLLIAGQSLQLRRDLPLDRMSPDRKIFQPDLRLPAVDVHLAPIRRPWQAIAEASFHQLYPFCELRPLVESSSRHQGVHAGMA